MFDVSRLIDLAENHEMVYKSFVSTAENEITYKDTKINIDDIVNDIFETALILSKREKNREEPMYSQYRELVSGIAKMKGYISGGSYRIDDVLEESAKTAYYLTALHFGKSGSFQLYTKDKNIANWMIENQNYNHLNKLKRSNKAAFYYWYKLLELNELIN